MYVGRQQILACLCALCDRGMSVRRSDCVIRAHTHAGEEGSRNDSKILENFEGITEGKGPSYSLPVPRVSPYPFLSGTLPPSPAFPCYLAY